MSEAFLGGSPNRTMASGPWRNGERRVRYSRARGQVLSSRPSVVSLALGAPGPLARSHPPRATQTRSHLHSQHQADEVHHHLLIGQLDADERQQAVECLVVLLYVCLLLTAQVDVSVELLGVLGVGRGGARPRGQVEVGGARRT